MTSDRKRLVRMARSALLVAGLSAVTLALTLAWQMSIAQAFGASGRLDAFWIALSIPRAIADSFHLGLLTLLFVLVFHRDASSDAAERWRQASAVLNVTLVVTAIAIVALATSADPLVRFMAPGLSTGHHALAASMLRRLTLMLVPTAIGAANVVHAIANQQLLPFALSRAAVPALQILTLAAMARLVGIDALIWALWIGAAGALAVYVRWLRRIGFRYSVTLDLADEKTRRVLKLQLALAVIWVLITLNQMADRYFASTLGAGAVSALEFAWRFETPISQIVSLGVALPTFALLAQRAGEDRRAEFRSTLSVSARLLLLAVIPALAAMVLLREPLARLWLAHGAFSPDAAHVVAALLPALAPVYFCRAFASFLVFGMLMIGRARLLVCALAVETVTNASLDFLLSRVMGLRGIALAGAIAMCAVNGALWLVLLRDTGTQEATPVHLRRLAPRPTLRSAE